MHEPLQIGLLLPTRGAMLSKDAAAGAEGVLRLAERAEAAGCDSVWVGDSLTAKPRLDPLITLSSIAACTRQVQLGTAVLLGALYPPVLLARAAASLHLLSGGRLVLAMGVGGAFNEAQRREWVAAGVPAQERTGRLEDLVQVLPRLWAGERVTFQGRYLQLDDVALLPGPLGPPGVPLWLACHQHTGSDAQFQRAGRWANGVISITDSPEEFREVWQRVSDAAAAQGRDPQALDRAFYLTVNLNSNEEQARLEADAFIRSYYGTNWWGDRWGPFGHPDAVAERVLSYAAAGARHLIIRFAAFDQEAQMTRFEESLLPALRRATTTPDPPAR